MRIGFIMVVWIALFLFSSLEATTPVPNFCVRPVCAVMEHSLLKWSEIADLLGLSHANKQQCYPERDSVAFAQDDELWSLQADQWKIKTRQGQASQLVGDLLFRSSGQSLLSREAWLWRSSDGGLDKLCLPEHATWQHSSWKVGVSHLLYQADSDEVLACDNAFVLYGLRDQPLYGSAKEIRTYGRDELVLKSVNATPCPLDDPAWSVSADQLDWSVKSKQARLQNVRFYWYDYPVFYVKDWRMSVGGRNPYGWQSPRIASYYQDPLLLSYPYRFVSDRVQIASPWLGSGGSIGAAFYESDQRKGYHYQYLLRSGLHRHSPHFRYGGVFQGQLSSVFGSDSMHVQLLHMRDGWYAQYFSPQFLPDMRPNQDLPSHIFYHHQRGSLQTDFSLIGYQKFSSNGVLQDEIGVPYLHVLPRLTMRFVQGGLFWNATAENLVSESKKDHYPGVKRAVGYAGYNIHRGEAVAFQIGGWLKTQLVNTYNEWTNYQRQHAFVVPNVEMKYSPVASGPFKLSVSYAYTGHVDQNLDPVFQRKWQWFGDQWNYDKISSLDRIYDRNRFWVTARRQGLSDWQTVDLMIQHILDVRKPRVTLSQLGTEDPLVDNPRKVSVFELNDLKQSFFSRFVYVWPTHRLYQYAVNWTHSRLHLHMSRQPDHVVFQNQLVRVPMLRKIIGLYDFYQADMNKLYVGVDYFSGLDRSLAYRLGWKANRCCWQADASIHLKRWMSDDDSVSRFYQGWQPSARVNFSLKGISGVSK